MKRLTCGMLALLMAVSAAAQEAPRDKALVAAQPTGPVTVTSDRAEFDKNGTMVYLGNVQLQSDTLKLAGDRMVLQQFEQGQYQVQINGTPARLEHASVADSNGTLPEPIQATALNLNYDTRTGVIEITGKARMTRGKDEINGEHIRYNVSARSIEAAGGVKIVIQPPPPKKPAGTTP